MSRNAETGRAFAYHEATKHTPEKLRAARYELDWANMPNPYRYYEGTELVDLPADSPAPAGGTLAVLGGAQGSVAAATGSLDWYASLLFYSASISASKRVAATGSRYALRVNPSSGNLHPTEFHFAARGAGGIEAGLYHYLPASHMLERRGSGGYVAALALACGVARVDEVAALFVLTSNYWREAWKYRERAYRYCLHDVGHAWQALELAARALGADAEAYGSFADDQVREMLRVTDEWPMLAIAIRGAAVPAVGQPWVAHPGVPNVLSAERIEYPRIEQMHADCSLAVREAQWPVKAVGAARTLTGGEEFSVVTRRRRSALDFEGGERAISRQQLSMLLEAAVRPGESAVTLWLFVHRVSGLDPGLYRYDGASGELDLRRPGDQRVIAAALSLSQRLAGNSCVTFSMAARLGEIIRAHGNRGYRYAHFEAGAIGQRLYLAAEAMGFQSTGIGAFFDDEVHAYLGLQAREEQVIYHFACGYAVADPRLDA